MNRRVAPLNGRAEDDSPGPTYTSARTPTYTWGRTPTLEFIDRARAAGLTLAQTAEILEVRDAGGSPCGHVRDLLDRRLVEIDEQLEHLRLLRTSVAELRANAAQTSPEACTPESICRYL